MSTNDPPDYEGTIPPPRPRGLTMAALLAAQAMIAGAEEQAYYIPSGAFPNDPPDYEGTIPPARPGAYGAAPWMIRDTDCLSRYCMDQERSEREERLARINARGIPYPVNRRLAGRR